MRKNPLNLKVPQHSGNNIKHRAANCCPSLISASNSVISFTVYLCTEHFYGDLRDLTVTGLAAALNVMQQHHTHGNNFRYAFFLYKWKWIFCLLCHNLG